MVIRPDRPEDVAAVRRVNLAAFDSTAEADIVDALRSEPLPLISIVAEDAEGIVGHALFSAVTLDGFPQLRLMGLAPMAVLPHRQRQGIGSLLVEDGLKRCREAGVRAVVVLGHPGFYPRFGFAAAITRSLRSEFDVPDDAFMVTELAPGALAKCSGTIRYHSIFAGT